MSKKYNKKQIILSFLSFSSLVILPIFVTSCGLSFKNHNLTSNSKTWQIPTIPNANKKPTINSESNLNSFKNNEILNSLNFSSSTKTSLKKLHNFYPKQYIEEFKEKNLTKDKVQEIIFNHNIPSNYYSHPKFKLERKYITLDKEKQVEKLKLLDSENNQEIQNVTWYQRLRIPNDKLLSINENDDNSLINLNSDGTISAKKHKNSSDVDVVELWAEHKGSLYKIEVTIVPIHEVNIQKAKLEAKKIADQWRNLPTLEKITKAYDWMTKEVKFDYNISNSYDNQSAYSALVNKSTVCTGYAKGFQMLMDELGISCTLITSDISPRDPNGVKHVWNLVEIDGEWYHLDTTSDRIENNQKQEYRFFLLHDDDFTKDDVFVRKTRNFGERFRNLKLSNFVKNKEDIDTLIDKHLNESKNSYPKKLQVKTHQNMYNEISKAIQESGFQIQNFQFIRDGSAYTSYKTINYNLKEEKTIDIKEIKTEKIEKYQNNNKSKALGDYAIKITFNQKVDNLKIKNFMIENALIKEIEQDKNSYILYLDHFTNFNKVNVKLTDIKKRGFKFNLSDNSVEFEVKKFDKKPEAIVKAVGENEVLISNVKSGMQYRNNLSQWIDIKTESFIAENIVLGRLQFRWKDSFDKFASDIQNVEITKANDVYNIVKLEKPNTIIGVDNTMEYRVINKNSQWESIISNKIENLKSGTYEIRTKANNNSLASNSHQITIN
ncbi:lipoprotein [Mycoplasma capricolum subsp. capricolum]|uniref:MAG6410 family transglutaminase-related lipoprotein n=1 Tax=Mycoplasma capricolum TaxID=2095 RepID=UPI0020BD889E|nr:transglutaminase domain-containing protein [Mycoplasma capricolum]MCK8462150.1 lipoprotein [Mycoplasma capricolum subsp. capricolum]